MTDIKCGAGRGSDTTGAGARNTRPTSLTESAEELAQTVREDLSEAYLNGAFEDDQPYEPKSFAALDALEARMKDREHAQKVCPACGHEWSRHDPEDGMCDAHSDEVGVFGACRCGREVTFTQDANIRLSRAALGADESTTTRGDV